LHFAPARVKTDIFVGIRPLTQTHWPRFKELLWQEKA
jgi:hypothetical protein